MKILLEASKVEQNRQNTIQFDLSWLIFFISESSFSLCKNRDILTGLLPLHNGLKMGKILQLCTIISRLKSTSLNIRPPRDPWGPLDSGLIRTVFLYSFPKRISKNAFQKSFLKKKICTQFWIPLTRLCGEFSKVHSHYYSNNTLILAFQAKSSITSFIFCISDFGLLWPFAVTFLLSGRI